MLSSYLSKNIFITRILPVFALGIIIGFIFPTVELLPYQIALILLFIIFLVSKKGYLVSIFFLLLGFTIIQSKLNTHCQNQNDKESIINGTIITPIQQGKKSKHFIVETNKGLRINVYISEKTVRLKQNDKIKLQTSIYKIENRINSSFNYKKYMKTQYCSHFCFTDSIKLINQNTIENSVLSIANSAHKHLADGFLNSRLTHETSSIISAMLIGERSQIKKDTKENYIKAGAIHILAISGLHMGIIFLLVKLLLCKIFKMREYSYLFMLISLSCLWTYALVTNLPTSVLRACLIISFIIVAKVIKRDYCIYNSIGASAFIILLYDPASLFTPGFQLSYSAYTSIIYFFPKIKSLLNFKSIYITRIWEIIVLSFSAQIGTIPISCIFFGQIANYSIITNLLITIFIPIIIYTSILWYIVRIDFLADLLNIIISSTNHIIKVISELPGSTIHININLIEGITLYMIGLTLFWIIWFKRKNLIWINLISVFILAVCFSIDKILLITG